MKIIKHYDSNSEDALSYDENKDCALFAVSCGAGTSIWKTFENVEIRKHVHFFKCVGQSDYNLSLELEAVGIVGPSKGSMRQVLIQDEDKLEQLLKLGL